MTRTRSLLTVLVTLAAATALFWLVLHEVSGLWLDVALRPEVREALERSMEDQRRLRRHDPENREAYRKRFEETRTLVRRIELLRMNREAMLRRFELSLLVVFFVTTAIAALVTWIRYRRQRERERREYVERLQSLQETARRHAHEIKGPLTAARLELERLGELARGGGDESEVLRAQESVAEELDRLAKFTREFVSFGGLGKPVLRREPLARVVEEFCVTFAHAWGKLDLRTANANGDVLVCTDRDMLRQVLVNLCSNSAGAGAQSVTLTVTRAASRVALDVRDDGGGVPDALRARVFDPYVTTKKIGEGMGLGLAISRKIMLDHGGDLQLVETSSSGTTFRLTFGELECS